tara:strand:+ start:896 stop:1165 length:270 start_codon:yes stop_codon:yes gene_type:complete
MLETIKDIFGPYFEEKGREMPTEPEFDDDAWKEAWNKLDAACVQYMSVCPSRPEDWSAVQAAMKTIVDFEGSSWTYEMLQFRCRKDYWS